MGNLRRFTCPACQRAWTLKLGHGIMHSTLENVLREFPEEIRQSVPETAAGAELFHFQYQAAVCGHCGELVSVPVLELAGERYTGPCPLCGGAASVLEAPPPFPCPHCRAPQLSEQAAGRWD